MRHMETIYRMKAKRMKLEKMMNTKRSQGIMWRRKMKIQKKRKRTHKNIETKKLN
jgi:hypothetical protein